MTLTGSQGSEHPTPPPPPPPIPVSLFWGLGQGIALHAEPVASVSVLLISAFLTRIEKMRVCDFFPQISANFSPISVPGDQIDHGPFVSSPLLCQGQISQLAESLFQLGFTYQGHRTAASIALGIAGTHKPFSNNASRPCRGALLVHSPLFLYKVVPYPSLISSILSRSGIPQ